MRLGMHILELRKRLLISAIAIAVTAVLGWYLSDFVWQLLREPVTKIAASGRNAQIAFTDVTSSFDLKLRISVFIAVILACPVWLYQVWAFFAPGLKKSEKLIGIGFIFSAVPLFLGGALTAWFVLPNIVPLLTGFSSANDALLLSAREYLDFATRLMIAVGLAYVMPVFLVLLNFAGVISGKGILKQWRIAILAISLFAAIATPAADVISMFVLAVPMVILYFLAVLIAVLRDRQRAKKLRAELGDDYAASAADVADATGAPHKTAGQGA